MHSSLPAHVKPRHCNALTGEIAKQKGGSSLLYNTANGDKRSQLQFFHVTFVSWPAKTTAPMMKPVFRRLHPLNTTDAGVRGSVKLRSTTGGTSKRLPVKV